MNLSQHPVPSGYNLISDRASWKTLPLGTIILTPMGWVKPLNFSVSHTHDGPIAVPRHLCILEEADLVVSGDRQQDYGEASASFKRIADFWTTYLDEKLSSNITDIDVAQMMVLLKISRSRTSPKRDTFVDQAGYTKLAYELTTLRLS